MSRRIRWLVVLGLGGLIYDPAAAETDQVVLEVHSLRAAMGALRILDREEVAKREIQELRAWLDAVEKEQAAGASERAEELLFRCQAQAELIRHLAESATLRARVRSRQTDVEGLRKKTDRVRGALDRALIKKKALEEKLKLGNDRDADADAEEG